MASSSTLNPSVKIDIPYPSHNFANQNIVTVKLSCRDVYHLWEEQMLCLLTSHDMLGFIDGRFPSPFDDGRSGKDKEEELSRIAPFLKAWIISDSLVKGWILGSLSEKVAIVVVNRLASEHKIISTNTFYNKKPYFSAKDAWDELKLIYGPSFPQQTKGYSTPEDAYIGLFYEAKIHELSRAHRSLYRFILRGKSEKAYDKLRELELKPTEIITSDGNTSLLHVAVSTKNQELLVKLLDMIRPEENSELLNMQNLDGSTLLHVAAIVGNTEAADELVKRNPELLFVKDKKGYTPLAVSLSTKHIKTSQCLLDYHAKFYEQSDTMFSGTSGDALLVLAISSKKISLSLRLVRLFEIEDGEAVLMAIVQNFPCELSFWERIDQDYHAWEDKHRRLIRSCGPSVEVIWKFLIFGISMIHMVSVTIIKKIVSPFIKERLQTRDDAIDLLRAVFCNLEKSIGYSSLSKYYTNVVFEATRLNAFAVVGEIVSQYPNAIWNINEDGLNFIQYAVINRSEKIFKLLYRNRPLLYKPPLSCGARLFWSKCTSFKADSKGGGSGQKSTPPYRGGQDKMGHRNIISGQLNIFKTIKDSYGNNLLHLAGRLAPPHKLNLISGAVLQIQRELQWFQEVEEFVGPITRMEKNYAGETPKMVFTREHMDLLIEGEQWMKKTAELYMIATTVIVTIVFTAAFTAPGGSNQDTGIPIHDNNIAFTVFGASVAISLFTAITSFLMFLSIFTARFYVEDFLYKLPTKLIIGLAVLIISTSAMITAFGATLFLVFGHDKSWILIPIGVLTCLPITCFVTLQFPRIADLTCATYGRLRFSFNRYSSEKTPLEAVRFPGGSR